MTEVLSLAKSTNDQRFAYDSYRRFISMYGRIVLGIDGAKFEHPFQDAEISRVASDAELSASVLSRYAKRTNRCQR